MKLDEETGSPIHDTKNPLDCCDRCRTAEIGRRSGRRPNLRYSTTAKTGIVDVVRSDGTTVATLRKDSLFGWFVSVAPELDGVLGAVGETLEGLTRREALDGFCSAYVAAWKNGDVR